LKIKDTLTPIHLCQAVHLNWMNIALEEAEKSKKKDEVPVGAVIVLDGEIIGRGHNQPISKNDPSSHAEIEAIRDAAKNIENYRLNGANIYVTLEPCTMCYGAIVHSRISNIFFGAPDPKSGVCGSCEDLSQRYYLNHRPLIMGQIMEQECSKILKDFFKAKRF
jgi:tRNA(adenine34) deaminase